MALLNKTQRKLVIIENIEVIVFFTIFVFFGVRRTPGYITTYGTHILKDRMIYERVLEYWKNVEKDKFSSIFLCFAIFAQWAKKRNFLEFSEP